MGKGPITLLGGGSKVKSQHVKLLHVCIITKVWGKVMFLHMSVVLCHFLSGCLVPCSFQGVFVHGVSVQRGSVGEGVLCREGGAVCPGREVSVQGRGLCPGGISVRETPRTVKSRRYASYWNAFLSSCCVLFCRWIRMSWSMRSGSAGRMWLP